MVILSFEHRTKVSSIYFEITFQEKKIRRSFIRFICDSLNKIYTLIDLE